MIQDKSEFVFVSENALKNIAFKGAAYPVRKQKLVLLGEDAAILEEAIRERIFYSQRTGLNSECTGAGAQDGEITTHVRYDTRIREIRETETAFYSRIKAMFGDWIDRSKAEEIDAPSNPIIKCAGEENRDDYIEKQAQCQSIESNYERAVADQVDAHEQILDELEDGYNSAVQTENNRFASSTAISDAETAYANAVEEAQTSHDSAIKSENETAESNVKSINDRFQAGEIDYAEKNELLSREAERHMQELQKADNALVKAKDEAAVALNKATIAATEAHYDTLEELKTEYEDAVEEENKKHEETLGGLLDERDDAIYAIASSNPYFFDEVLSNQWSKAWRKRDEAFRQAVIRISCADKFFSRDPLYRPASSAIDRIYADLERLDTVCSPSLTLFREARYYTVDGNRSGGYRYSEALSSAGGQILSIDKNGREGVWSSNDFYFLYGMRHEIDSIESIVADVIIKRTDTWSAEDERREIVEDAEGAAAGAMANVQSKYWRWESRWIMLVDTEGMSAAELQAAQESVETANSILSQAYDEAAEIYDKRSNAYSIARTEFVLKETPNADIYGQLDDLSDAFEDERAALLEAKRSKYDDARKGCNEDIETAQAAYDDAEGRAASVRDGAIADAHLSYVTTLFDLSLDINTRMANAETDADKRAVLAEFYSRQSEVADAEDDAVRTAQDNYDDAVRTAQDDYDDAVRTAKSVRSEKERAADSEFDTEYESLMQRFGRAAKAIRDEHDKKPENVQTQYAQARQAAAAARFGVANEARQSAENAMEAEFGDPADPNSYYGWWMDYSNSGIWTVRVGEYENDDADIREKAARLNGAIVPRQQQAWHEYYEAVEEADRSEWEDISEIYDITPLARGKFVATIAPADSCGLPGAGVAQDVTVVGFKNVEVRYKPWTATGADFSEYYEELEEEDVDDDESDSASTPSGGGQ